ncbi:MAG TPA: hypothetical protein VII20_20085, partial [Roseiarcus sp.]
GEVVGQLAGGGPFSPRVRLLGELGPAATRERGARRLEAFVAAEASARLSVLKRLQAAMAEGRLRGLARGLAYQLVEQFGVLDRKRVESEIRALSQKERRILKGLGVRFGAFSLYLPALLAPEAQAICNAFAELAEPDWRPGGGALNVLPRPAPPPEALALRGLRAIAGFAAPVLALERLDALARAATPDGGGAILLTAEMLAGLGWEPGQAKQILRALGFAPTRKPAAGDHGLWRRRRQQAEGAEPAGSAFAVLAPLNAEPSSRARRARRKRVRRRAAS